MKRHHQNDLSEHKSVTKLATIFKKENNVLIAEPEENYHSQQENDNKEIAQPKNLYIESERIKKRERWKNNKRAGAFYTEIEKPYIDKKGSFQWLQNGILTFNEERLVIAAQDCGIMTNGLKKVCKLTDNDKCRFVWVQDSNGRWSLYKKAQQSVQISSLDNSE